MMMTDEQKRHARELRYRRQYGITIEDYDVMLLYQKNVCAICGKPAKVLRLSVDHEHKSGLVRGLLCVTCNKTLNERVSKEWLENALQYLIAPPSLVALGRLPQGRIGRVTKKHPRKKNGQATV